MKSHNFMFSQSLWYHFISVPQNWSFFIIVPPIFVWKKSGVRVSKKFHHSVCKHHRCSNCICVMFIWCFGSNWCALLTVKNFFLFTKNSFVKEILWNIFKSFQWDIGTLFRVLREMKTICCCSWEVVEQDYDYIIGDSTLKGKKTCKDKEKLKKACDLTSPCSTEECQKICDLNEKCTHIHIWKDGLCFLMKSCDTRKNLDSAKSATLKRTSNWNYFVIYCFFLFLKNGRKIKKIVFSSKSLDFAAFFTSFFSWQNNSILQHFWQMFLQKRILSTVA